MAIRKNAVVYWSACVLAGKLCLFFFTQNDFNFDDLIIWKVYALLMCFR